MNKLNLKAVIVCHEIEELDEVRVTEILGGAVGTFMIALADADEI